MATNEVMIPSGAQLPAHILALLQKNPSLLAINENAANGIGGGSVPTIIAYMGAFKTKVDGVEAPIQIETTQGMMNASKISAVILAAKRVLVRTFYMGAWAPGQEPQSPDCSSDDGIKPRADSPNKQCESCAGCERNVWGSAKNDKNEATKGKACAERKIIAVYANGGIYKMAIPPASLGDFGAYGKQLGAHGLPLPTVITSISFDPAVPTKWVYSYVNIIQEVNAKGDRVLDRILAMIDSPEVKAIIEDNFTAPQSSLPAPPVEDPAIAAAAAKKIADAQAATEKAAKAAEAKAAKELKAAAAAAAKQPDLGLDLGGEAGPELGSLDDSPSDDALNALLGL